MISSVSSAGLKGRLQRNMMRAEKEKFDGEGPFVYGSPETGRRDQEFLKQQATFNFTWRLINNNGIDQMKDF